MTESQHNQKSQLILTALGADRPGLVSELSQIIFDCGCDIVDSRMIALGGEFSIIMQISGSWNTVAKLEAQAKQIEHKIGMTVVAKRTTAKKVSKVQLPYYIDVVALDHPGIVYKLAKFFSDRKINIEELATNSYAAAHTGSPMFSVHMEIWIDATSPISELREAFMTLCDELNLDAIIEPAKG